MMFAAALYLIAVQPAKKRVRAALAERGLAAPASYELISTASQLRLSSAATALCWPNEDTRLYSLGNGLLIHPEADVFFLVPKSGEFDAVSFQAFRRILRERLSGDRRSLVRRTLL